MGLGRFARANDDTARRLAALHLRPKSRCCRRHAYDEAEAERRDPARRQKQAAARRASRGALPAHLPRVEIVLAPKESACPCCQTPMVVIGEDTSERLDVVPVQFRVLVTRRPKLACRACAGMVRQHPAPPRLIEGGL